MDDAIRAVLLRHNDVVLERHTHTFGSPMDRTFRYPDMANSNLITRTVELRICSKCDFVTVKTVNVSQQRIADWYYNELTKEMERLRLEEFKALGIPNAPVLPPQSSSNKMSD